MSLTSCRIRLLTFELFALDKKSTHLNLNISEDSWPSLIIVYVAQLDARATGDQEVAGSTHAGSASFFRGIDHEIFSMVILSLPLI